MPNRTVVVALVIAFATACSGSDDVAAPDTRSSEPTESGSPGVEAFCVEFATLQGERSESYVGSPDHLGDIDELLGVAPDPVNEDVAVFRDYLASGAIDSDADPESNLYENWPADVQTAIASIQTFAAQNCSETVEDAAVAPSTVLDVSATTPIQSPPSESTAEATAASDPADPYLDQTTVVFDEVMNDDLRFVVRLSDVSYGELFDIDWTAPTGSTEECLSGPALITGNPEGLRTNSSNNASSWDANHLSPLSEARPTDVTMAASAFGFGIEPDSATTVFVVRTRLPVSEVVVEGDGITTTSTEIIDGVAAFEVTAEMIRDERGSGSVRWNEVSITLQPEPGADIDPSLLTLPLFGDDTVGLTPPECMPTFPPDVELPPPGEQPSDPVGAEAIIRNRFALAVDPTIPFGEKPDDLFDSTVGLEQAINEALAGPNAAYVRDARHDIVDMVFTSPAEAWFQYDLDALGVTFRPFGRATLSGESWQISRNTICQDLARTGVPCEPAARDETPPSDPTVAPPTTLSEQDLAAYADALICNPIRPCEDR